MNLFQKLLSIQKQINGLGKDKAAFQYKYVTGDKLLGHVKPMMNELGIILKQEIISIENVRQDYHTIDKNGQIKNKNEILSKVMMRFTWIDAESGEKDENLFGANGQNDWDKGVGSALTYAERYFLLKFFHIATDEDDIDNPDRKPEEGEVTPAQKEAAILLKHTDALNKVQSMTDLIKYYNGLSEYEKSSKELTKIFTKRKTELSKTATKAA